jgi:small subunit ribosomal protein S6
LSTLDARLSFAAGSGNVKRFQSGQALNSEEVSGLYPYEILLIFDPRPTEEEVTALLTKLQETLRSLGGEVTKAESWGKRRLAYEIRKQREGTYAVIECKAVPAVVKEYERQLTLNEQVLRHFTTRVPVRKRIRSAPKPQTPAVEEVV